MPNVWSAEVKHTIPMLSGMVVVNKTMIHSDKDGLYMVFVKPGYGIVALFGPMLFSDKCWTADNIWNDETSVTTQQRKCESPEVREELLKLQKTATRHGVSMDDALLVDCGDRPLGEIAQIVQEAFAMDLPFQFVRAQVLACVRNNVGNALTAVAQKEVWCIGGVGFSGLPG